MGERLAFLLDGVPEAERTARCRDRSLTQKPTSPYHRLPLTAFETHNGRSTFATGTALHAPLRPAWDPTAPVVIEHGFLTGNDYLQKSETERHGYG
jgi:hypothetical protein